MPNYQYVIDVLMKGRPQSSRESIAKVVQRLGNTVSKEASKIQGGGYSSDAAVIWMSLKDRSVFQDEMQNLLREVDRMHVLYVYSRFLNSKAVGPILVDAALKGEG